MKSVRKVVTPRPYIIARAIDFQNLALSAPNTKIVSLEKSKSIPIAIGISPSTVVTAVRMTGRNRTAEAIIIASFLGSHLFLNLTT